MPIDTSAAKPGDRGYAVSLVDSCLRDIIYHPSLPAGVVSYIEQEIRFAFLAGYRARLEETNTLNWTWK